MTTIPQGGGEFLLKPGKPIQWLTVMQASRIAGVSVWTIYRLAETGFLKFARPSPKKILILAESLQAHLAACQDPEFWEDPQRRAAASLR